MTIPEDSTQSQGQWENAAAPQKQTSHPGGCIVEIRVWGHLDNSWSDWLDAMQVQTLDNGETLLTGRVQDQAALLGTLMKLHGLGIRVLAFNPVTRCHCDDPVERIEGRTRGRTEAPLEPSER